MEELINLADEVGAILDGKMSASDASETAQTWLKVSVAMYAVDIVRAPKEDRKQLLTVIEKEQPMFVDDVKSMARAIIQSGIDTIPF